MPLTLDDIRARMYGDETTDPIAGDPKEVVDNGSELIVLGTDTDPAISDYRDHLRMVQEGDGVRLWVRDKSDQEWQDNGLFDEFDELHGWIYEL